MTVRAGIGLLAIIFLVLAVAGCSRNDGAVPVDLPTPTAAVEPPRAEKENGEGTQDPQDLPDLSDDPPPGEVAAVPEIRGLWFVGGDGTVGNTLGIEFETYDPGGNVVQVDIAWMINGEPAGAGKFIPVAIRRDDKVTVTLTPSNGKETGKAATLSRVIMNSPPVVEGHHNFQFEETAIVFQVRASDPDGDPLKFALKNAPPGMTINQDTGTVRWEFEPGKTGKFPFTVEVSDGFGGTATAILSVTIESPAVPETQ